MTSQISLSKLMKIDIRSRRWLIVLSSVIQFVFGPIAGLMSITTKGNYTIQYAISRAFNYEYAIFEVAIVIVGAILVSLIGFRFLFSKKMMDLYGSLPVSRTRLFMAVYINNFLTWFIPFVGSIVLTGLMCIAVDSSYTAQILLMMGKAFVSGVFAFLIIYHMCLVAVMISGHAFVSIANIFMMGLAVISVYGIIYYYAISYFNSFSEFIIKSVDVAWLSSLAGPFYVSGLFFNSWYSAESYTVFVIGSIVMIVINFMLAGCLFKNRKSELAEGGTKIRPYIIIIRSVAAFVCGVYLSFIFSVFAVGTVYVWSVIGIAIGAVAGFGIVNMILYRTGKAFFKDKFIMFGTLVGSIFFYTVFAADLFGYDAYVPAEAHIVKAEINFSDFYDQGKYLAVEDGVVVDEIWSEVDDKAYTCDDAEIIHELLTLGAARAKEQGHESMSLFDALIRDNYSDDFYQYSTTLRVKVYLSNGTSYYRSYCVKANSEIVEKVVNSQGYRDVNYPMSTGAMDVLPEYINIYSYDEDEYYDLTIDNPELVEMMLECYRRDFKENPIASDYDYEASFSCEIPVYEKNRDYYDADGNLMPFHYTYIYLRVGEGYERTLKISEILQNINYTEYKYNQEAVDEALKEAIQEILDMN